MAFIMIRFCYRLKWLLCLIQHFIKNLDYVKDVFQKVNIKITPYYSDYLYDVSNLRNPITRGVEATLYSYINIDYYGRTNLFLNKLIYFQDKNLLFKNQKNQNYIKTKNWFYSTGKFSYYKECL